jgi:hypothetical protein
MELAIMVGAISFIVGANVSRARTLRGVPVAGVSGRLVSIFRFMSVILSGVLTAEIIPLP